MLMKKLITLLLAVAGMVNVHAAKTIYLLSDVTTWDTNKESSYAFTSVWDGDNSQDVHTYTINASGRTTDIYFRLHFSGWGNQIRPYHDDNQNNDYVYVFSNGQWETYENVYYNNTTFQGDGKAFGIEHSAIKANSYKITLYDKYYDNTMHIKVEIVDMPLTISDASGYATFSCDRALDFSSVSGITAYTASAPANGSVTMTEVSGAVPANTGLFIKGTASETPYSIPVVTTSSASAISGNYLHATDGNSVAAGNYVFAKQGTDVGFYVLGSATVVPKGKAYLSSTAASGARLSINFDEATAISSVKSAADENSCFDLQGRRVAQPSKGLYIINGKKVIK